MRTTTGTQTGPDQRAATVPGVPSQGLAEAQGKVVPRPHSKPRRALGTRQPHNTGHALKPAPALPSAPASGDRQVAWSQALEQKEVKPRCDTARPRLLSVSVHVQVQSEPPGPGLTRDRLPGLRSSRGPVIPAGACYQQQALAG